MTPARFSALADALVLGPYLAFSSRNERNKYFRAGLVLVGVGMALYGLSRFRAEQGSEAEPLAGLGAGAALRVAGTRRFR